MKPQRDNKLEALDEMSLQLALNVLRESVASKRMPSGVPLEGYGMAVQEQAIAHLEDRLRKLKAREARGASR